MLSFRHTKSGWGVISSLETIRLKYESYSGVSVGLSSIPDLGTEIIFI
jgi:hypothetical protein